MQKLTSKKQLEADLIEMGHSGQTDSEKYGSMTYMYFYHNSNENKIKAEQALQALGHRVNFGYSVGGRSSEVQVKRFRANLPGE